MEGEERAKTEADSGLSSSQVELDILGIPRQRFETIISGRVTGG